eukprot:8760029-Pyramimonas_sp.AAC.1
MVGALCFFSFPIGLRGFTTTPRWPKGAPSNRPQEGPSKRPQKGPEAIEGTRRDASLRQQQATGGGHVHGRRQPPATRAKATEVTPAICVGREASNQRRVARGLAIISGWAGG